MSKQEQLYRGPIPGENYTSDVRNYPWHRPPDLTDYDEIVDYAFNNMADEDNIDKVIALLGAGMDVATLVGIAHLQNISIGKYSIDMALLTAGPLARLLQIHAEKAGIAVDMGLENPNPPTTKEDVLRALGQENEEIVEQADTPVEELQEGLMSKTNEVASEEEQNEMLGMIPDTLEERVIE